VNERTVLVGIDGSAESHAALRWACRYAAQLGKPLCAVAVWQDQLQFGPAAVFPEPEFEAEARSWLDTALSDVPAELTPVEVSTRIGRGDPARVLTDLAEDADVLVLGNRGRGPLRGALLGSVALRCAHHARCPVVLVADDAAENDGGPG
jgi:nucleotide-binding universal stress UspA family protein